MYIPVNTTYQLLKNEVNEFVYMNSYDVLYFTIYNTIYSYNLTTRTLQPLVENVSPKKIVFLEELKHVVWQVKDEAGNEGALTVLDLETGKTRTIEAAANEQICLLGRIDNNLVYGYAKEADIATNLDGTKTVPMYRMVIADLAGTVFKEYAQDGYYVTEALFEDNVIRLTRVKKAETPELHYAVAAPDAIQNRTESETASVYITGRVTDLAKKEYYITFPGDVQIDEVPELKTAPLTVLSSDPTVRINPSDEVPEQYMTYSFGRIVVCSPDAVDAIHRANEDENVGAVMNGKGKVIWERGVKSARASISGIKSVVTPGQNGLLAALRVIFTYEGYNIDTSGISFESQNVTEWLEQHLKVTALDLKGANMDEVLYYVYKKYPVTVLQEDNQVIMLIGYDQENVEIMDPARGTIQKMEKSAAEELFEANGNVFFTYID